MSKVHSETAIEISKFQKNSSRLGAPVRDFVPVSGHIFLRGPFQPYGWRSEAQNDIYMFEGKVTMAEIGPRLKLIRQNMGITQRELARELGINQAILSKFERGNMVYASVLLDVLSYFRGHIDVNYLLQPGNGFNLNDERHAFSNHSQRDFFIDQIENHTIEKINDSISEAQQDLNKFKEKVEQLVHDMARMSRSE